jgi:anaerobic selenocysteine-containing dehydrogenase
LGHQDIDLSRATHLSPLFPSSFTLLGKPGTEGSILNAMIQTILRKGFEDKSFIEEKTEGMNELKQRMAALEPFEGNRDEMKRLQRFCLGQEGHDSYWVGTWSSLDLKGISIASATLASRHNHRERVRWYPTLLEKCNDQGAIRSDDPFPWRYERRKGPSSKSAEGD